LPHASPSPQGEPAEVEAKEVVATEPSAGEGAPSADGFGMAGRAMLLVVTVTVLFGGYAALRKITGRRALVAAPEVAIPAGTLRTEEGGSLTLTSFQLDETEVTVRAYRACVDARICTPAGVAQGCNSVQPMSDAHPINCVDHAQAEAFCRWAGRRLPTEDEWEFAARGPDGRTFPWGGEVPDGTRANFADRSLVEWRREAGREGPPTLLPASDGWPNSASVGSFAAGRTREGVADLAGNVREWTASLACEKRGASCSPITPSGKAAWSVRGGGFLTARIDETRAAFRERVEADTRVEDLGFRCAR
jgi:formylglycine-generating enzyme required for sulfatase activity